MSWDGYGFINGNYTIVTIVFVISCSKGLSIGYSATGGVILALACGVGIFADIGIKLRILFEMQR